MYSGYSTSISRCTNGRSTWNWQNNAGKSSSNRVQDDFFQHMLVYAHVQVSRRVREARSLVVRHGTILCAIYDLHRRDRLDLFEKRRVKRTRSESTCEIRAACSNGRRVHSTGRRPNQNGCCSR